jgi:hypothetical protein
MIVVAKHGMACRGRRKEWLSQVNGRALEEQGILSIGDTGDLSLGKV